MDFDEYDEQPTWGVASPRDNDGDLGVVRETLKKEQTIKCVSTTFPHGIAPEHHVQFVIREIIACQEGLKAMLAKVQGVQKEVDKLTSGNETLQMYIDNLTVQMAKRR
ncbi:hypothetical protein D9619_007296 [Psilocybe cf. subviscida]|uniref:Uncharacterized protein n=1 Tax=Psilocybe cf. subviscida TaxID=2480587 RepID=A0A8H5B1X3_9AGAR|nr:hypothetical protein D9619_007296 [Psilocybe cf. subviscida]